PPRLAHLLGSETRPCSACGTGHDPSAASGAAAPGAMASCPLGGDGAGTNGNGSPAAPAEAGGPATVVCDSCDATYHLDCLRPPLLQVPRAEWFCPACVCPGAAWDQRAGGAALARPPPAGGFGCGSRWSGAERVPGNGEAGAEALANGDDGGHAQGRGGAAAGCSDGAGAADDGRGSGNAEPPLLCGSGQGGSLETGGRWGTADGGVGGMGGMGEWGPCAGVPKALDWSLSRRARDCLESEEQARVLHDALRILSRREGGWLPSPSDCWSPGEWVAVLSALVGMAVETHSLNQFFSDAEQRCENLRKKAVSGAKMSARSFQ
ncbi:unnamed protein product, partial [Hapterophycus canaliculatus]